MQGGQSRLEAILTNAVDAIITIDMTGSVESANPATERVFGYDLSEVVGQNVKMLMPSPFAEQHDGYLQNYLDTGERKIIGIGREVIGRRKDGTVFPIHLAVSEFYDGERRLFTGIVRDISDLKEAERKLTKLNEELEDRVRERTRELREAQAELLTKEKLATLGQVSGGIAHEIRNPLNAVKTSIYYLVHSKNRSEEKLVEHFNRIDRQVTLIDNVVTALSDVAKMPEPKVGPLSIRKLLHGVVQSMTIPDNVNVIWDLPDDLPKILVDANQIPIVFRNLVRNARDAMEGGGELTIRASSVDSHVSIQIADTGIGIAPDDLKRIMEPLYSTKARGMGLGLAITRAIVEKNRGEVRVESTLGEGSRFTVILNAAQDST